MSLAWAQKLVTYLFAAIGFGALLYGGYLSTWLIVGAAIGFVASWWAEPPLIDSPQWTRAFTAITILLLVVQLVRMTGDTPVAKLVLEFTALLQVTRLWNRSNSRDHGYIVLIGFLHVTMATVLGRGPWFALVFLGFLIASPWMLTLNHLRSEIELLHADSPDKHRIALARPGLVGPGFFLGSAALSFPLLAGTALLFLLFPRVGAGFLDFGLDQTQRTTGFGDTVELGGFGVIRDDPTVVMRVTPLGDAPTGVLRMRGSAFTFYDGRRWFRRTVEPRRVRPMFQDYPRDNLELFPSDYVFEVSLDPLNEPVIFTPPRSVSVVMQKVTENAQPTHRRVFDTGDGELRYDDGQGRGAVYLAFLPRVPTDLIEPIPDELRHLYLQVPDGHERTAELARRVTAGIESDRDKGLALMRFLRDSGEYTYSLQQPEVASDALPLEVFLHDAKRGHCEYFSTALAIMLRSVGIASRNVTGFHGGDSNPYAEFMAIRNADAHSWTEAHIDGQWRTLDATPGLRRPFEVEDGILGNARELVEWMEHRWFDVVDYDLSDQATGGKAAINYAKRARSSYKLFASSAGAGAVVVIPILVGGALLALFVFWRRRRARVHPIARAFDRAFRRLNHARPSGVPIAEHAHSLGELDEELTSALALYQSARFGGGDRDDNAERAAAQAVSRWSKQRSDANKARGSIESGHSGP